MLAAIDGITGATGGNASTVDGTGHLVLSSGTNQSLVLSGTGNALAALGLSAGTTATGPTPITGETLSIARDRRRYAGHHHFRHRRRRSVDAERPQHRALRQQSAGQHLTTGALTIITSNDAASSTIGSVTGTATASGNAFNGASGSPPVVDPNSQATRANLVAQYNNVLTQINTTAQDASFNGINLLNGDTLKLVFNETGRSTLNIQGVTFNDAGLGLSTLTSGTDFLDSSSANKVLAQLDSASTTLRSESSALGSNLSIVQIRQDFNKNLINVLQTGASNLTLADTNEEAANSQALSTRQSIAVSALALANQSQRACCSSCGKARNSLEDTQDGGGNPAVFASRVAVDDAT